MPASRKATHARSALLAAAACAAALAPAAHAESIDEALALLPADAEAAIVVPSLKKASDDLTLCLERSEQQEALLAGRPLDVLEARLGVAVAVRDHGALVAALRPPAAGGTAPRRVVLVPVTDAQAFLDGNFNRVAGAEGVYTTAQGAVVHARPTGQHVAIAASADGLEGVGPDPARAEAFRKRLGARGAALLEHGDALLWSSGAGLRRALERSEAEAVRRGGDEAAGAIATLAPWRPYADGVADACLSIDFDALGVMTRGAAIAAPDSALAALLAGGASSGAPSLGRLPAGPFYVAASLDLAGLGGWDAFDRLVAPPGAPAVRLPDWMRTARAAQLGVYPSKLGVAVGGVMNDAALVLIADDPGALRDGLRGWLLGQAGERDGMRLEPSWETDRALRSGGSADAFELKETVLPGADATAGLTNRLLARSILFGNRGFHGLVRIVPGAPAKDASGAMVMTFSQRPDVLSRAVDAAQGGPSLAGDPVVAAMRGFMLPAPDAEVFVGVGAIGRLAQQVAALVPGGDASMIRIDPSTEPIGVAIAVGDGVVETASVVPASVIGVMIENGMLAVRPQPAP